MNTLISKLPPKLRALAEQERVLNPIKKDSDELHVAFIFDFSEHGVAFWEKVYHSSPNDLLQIESEL